MISSHKTAAEVRHKKRVKERERERESEGYIYIYIYIYIYNVNEKEKERNPNRQRTKEIGTFSMIRFDSATSSFLALLVIKS